MQHIKHAVISCAGLGSRLGVNTPKCLVKVRGHRVIDYLLPQLEEIEDIRVVVGFQEQEVMDHIAKIRSDVVFVRNANYAFTTNCHSVHLASHDLTEPFVIIDGDLIIEPESLKTFFEEIRTGESLIGITKSKTTEAVFVNMDEENNIVGFRRNPPLEYEWCGVAYLHDIPINPTSKYIYHDLARHLPLKSQIINCFEIDTPEDLDLARHEIENYRFLFLNEGLKK